MEFDTWIVELTVLYYIHMIRNMCITYIDNMWRNVISEKWIKSLWNPEVVAFENCVVAYNEITVDMTKSTWLNPHSADVAT